MEHVERDVIRLGGAIVVPGSASGPLTVSSEPLSFWGGYDAATGEIIDRRHPLSGMRVAGHILVLPWTRGSSTTTAILLEAVRRGQAPAAIVVPKVDTFIALASIVADEMYQRGFPVIVLDPAAFRDVPRHATASIAADGTLSVTSA
jgi:predicted aconitase with swiveling domain